VAGVNPTLSPPNHDIFPPTKEELPVGGSSLLTWQDWMGGGITQKVLCRSFGEAWPAEPRACKELLNPVEVWKPPPPPGFPSPR